MQIFFWILFKFSLNFIWISFEFHLNFLLNFIWIFFEFSLNLFIIEFLFPFFLFHKINIQTTHNRVIHSFQLPYFCWVTDCKKSSDSLSATGSCSFGSAVRDPRCFSRDFLSVEIRPSFFFLANLISLGRKRKRKRRERRKRKKRRKGGGGRKKGRKEKEKRRKKWANKEQ